MKTVKETKLKAVKEHLDDGLTIKEVCEKYKMNPAVLKFLTALYRRHGEEPLLVKIHQCHTSVFEIFDVDKMK